MDFQADYCNVLFISEVFSWLTAFSFDIEVFLLLLFFFTVRRGIIFYRIPNFTNLILNAFYLFFSVSFRFCLIQFYGISTIKGYLMPNPFVHTY